MNLYSRLKKNKKYCLVLLFTLCLSAVGILFWSIPSSQAQLLTIENIRLPVIGHVVGFLLYLAKFLLAQILYLAANLADAILKIDIFNKASIVQVGWAITRDLTNMFFALILLVIAFATILRVETYGMKQVLWKLVVVALLINFSLVIGGAIIDSTQVLTHFFIGPAMTGGRGTVSASIMSGLDVPKLYIVDQDKSWIDKIADKALGPDLGQITEQFLGVIILLVAIFVFLAFAFFLLARVIALWFLLILAPLAWLAMVLPATRHIWNQWWSSFLKWSFFAPIYAFFLYLTLSLIQSKALSGEINEALEHLEENKGALVMSQFLSHPGILLQYIVIVCLLVAGLEVAQKMSIYGAGAAISLGKGLKNAAGGWTSRQIAKQRLAPKPEEGARWSDKALYRMRRGVGLLSPRVIKGAWEARKAREEAKVFPRATGSVFDTMNWAFSLGKERTNFEEMGRQKEVDRIAKEEAVTGRSSERLNLTLANAIKNKDTERVEAVIRLLFEQNDQNDMVKSEILKDFGGNKEVTPETVKDFIYDNLKRVGLNEEQTAKVAMDLGNIASEHGKFMNFGMGTYKVDRVTGKGKFTKTTMDEQYAAGVAKTANVEAQRKLTMWHWNDFMQEEQNGATGHLHEGGMRLLNSITDAEVQQVNRARRDFIDRSIKRLDQIRNTANLPTVSPTQKTTIYNFAKALYARKTGVTINDAQLNALTPTQLNALVPNIP